ncbi:MAG TPA: hypothetical protein VIH99_10610, partial [Bdellovibrionota bacterium]
MRNARGLAALVWILGTASPAFAADYDFSPIFADGLFYDASSKSLHTSVYSRGVSLFDELEAGRASFSDYETFLAFLKQKEPEFFSNAVLIHHSRSLQPASLQFPRVILFSRGAFLSFSEHPSQKNFRRVEMIETTAGGSVRFREILFRPEGVEFHSAPKSCVACHGTPARPIWEPYDFWPTAYGSTIGRIGSDKELAALERIDRQVGIFRQLDWGKIVKKEPNFSAPSIVNNERITEGLGVLKFVQWARTNLKGIETSPTRFLLLSSLLCGGTNPFGGIMADYLPPRLLPAMHARDSILRSDVSIARKWFKDDLLGQYEKIFSGYRKISLSPGEPERLRQSDEKIADVRLALEPFGYSHLAAVNPFGLNDFVVGVPSNIAFDMPAAFLYARPEIFSGLNYRVVDDP